jgi:RNA polymerase sigma factor (sigma-70 family)
MRSIDERNKLINDNLYIADKIAQRRKMRCIKSITLAELKSAAYVGLMDAATKFDEKKGNFSVYAKYRIHGEINDFLRQYSGSRKRKKITFWSLDVPTYTVSFANLAPVSENLSNKYNETMHVNNADAYKNMVRCLTSVQRKVIDLYYIHGFSMKEIGDKLGVSESRISQIATEAKNIIKRTHDKSLIDTFDFSQNKPINFFRTSCLD